LHCLCPSSKFHALGLAGLMPVLCCWGPREHEIGDTPPSTNFAEVPGAQCQEEPNDEMTLMKSSATTVSEGAYASLVVKVLCAEGLLGVDPNFNFEKMVMESLQDPFVSLNINDDREAFAKTTVKWKSNGNASWDEIFSTDLDNPQSFLCITVMDDDPIFGQDNVLVATGRSIGSLEIPLAEMPRNQLVTGWFKLHHPDVANSSMSHADREQKVEEMRKQKSDKSGKSGETPSKKDNGETPRKKDNGDCEQTCSDEDCKDPLDAGRVKLQLLLQTTLTKEFFARMKLAPKFKQSSPPLDLPGFLEDVSQVKRLIVQRLIVAPIMAFLYAISWENPLLSTALLCWHVFVCYHKQYISASLWVVLLLCFWHEIPKEKLQESDEPTSPSNVVEGVLKGGDVFVNKLGQGFKSAFAKPMKGAKQDGIAGLAKGMQKGFRSHIKHTTAAWTDLAGNVKSGVAGTLGEMGIHKLGLRDFQNILLVQPWLADVIRGLQPTAKTIHKSLDQVDGYFYWADFKTTCKIVGGVVFVLLISIVLKGYMGALSGYVYLIIGSLLILAKAKFFKGIVRAVQSFIALSLKPKAPYSKQDWFEAVDSEKRHRLQARRGRRERFPIAESSSSS